MTNQASQVALVAVTSLLWLALVAFGAEPSSPRPGGCATAIVAQDNPTGIQGPPPLKTTPAEDTARYVAWMEKQGKPLTDQPHENVSLRLGDWGFFYHGERRAGSFSALLGRTALDRSGHAVTEAETSDWFALLSTSGLDAPQALKRVAWLFNADGLESGEGLGRPHKIVAPSLTTKDGVITFQGSCEAHTDPPYEMRLTIVATANGTKLERR